MAWKGLHLSEPARLSLADGQACVAQDGREVRIALEDLAWVVVDTPKATLTSALVSACMEAGIAIVFTDASHTPNGLALPFHRHHRQGGVARLQFACKESLKRKLWQAIVRRKILNQAALLTTAGKADSATLREMARHVEPGDPGNVEARAARFYWGRLFDEFIRDDAHDRRNKMLNYGYAVVRAGVARALVAAGFLPAIGLAHASVTNGFNLADDLVEAFRPFVDRVVWQTSEQGQGKHGELTLAHRQAMAGSLLIEARMGDDLVTLLVATETTATSLVYVFENGKIDCLVLPELDAA